MLVLHRTGEDKRALRLVDDVGVRSSDPIGCVMWNGTHDDAVVPSAADLAAFVAGRAGKP